ncbi:MAG: lytic murein transglycosylase [Solirubrobacteraceae bacterium]|jgi:hypothetical protein
MTVKPPSHRTLLALVLLMLALPARAGAEEPSATTPTTSTTTPAAQPAPSATSPGATTTTTTTTTAPATTTTSTPGTPPPGSSEAGPEAGGPQVQARHVQSATPGKSSGKGGAHAKTQGEGTGAPVAGSRSQTTTGASEPGVRAGHSAPAPSTLTPKLPLSLGGSLSGVSGFFVESFEIPPFLLPIYQAAGTAYGIPWQVLAAINQVETDYGRDLSLSSAGAEGWMQFLPSTWARYGVDATGAGYKDPYNPADAIFAAARYLRAAGGDTNIRAAVYSYNHSQAYVDSVMLRAQLLGGTPPELLGAITGLTESQFPVHAPSHFSDGFAQVSAQGSSPSKTLAGTTIYSQAGAPVVAVQDGEVVQIGDSPSLGRFVSLRDAYGNTYVYAQLGSVASVYPVLEPHEHTAVSARIARTGGVGSKAEPAPSGPATAGAQPRSPLSEGATVSGLALGAAAGLESPPSAPAPVPAPVSTTPALPKKPPANVREFTAGPDDVYLHTLSPGVQVLAGTVLGHVGGEAGSADGAGATGDAGAAGPATGPGAGTQAGEPHMFFQIKPAGAGAPLIDPKPILDGWVALQDTSIFGARGENPFLATSPTVGQVLLESKQQLQQLLARDQSIHMRLCERQYVQTGKVGKPVLAALEYLSVSGLKPTVSGLRCAGAAPASEGNASARSGNTFKIIAINGVPIAGHQGLGSIADATIRKLLMLEGLNRPRRIVSLTSIPGTTSTFVKPSAGAYIKIAFGSHGTGVGGGGAHAATALDSALTPSEWVKLIARLGEIPDPTVSSGPSPAAIPDTPSAGEGAAGGNG